MNKTVFSRFFLKDRHHKKEDNMTAMLLPSIFGIILCAVCLMGSTLAWFTATKGTATQPIQAANYTVNVKLNDTQLDTNTVITLEKNTYSVTLTAYGDASTGYCKVIVGNTERLTQQFPSAKYPEKSITFTLVINEPARVEFIPCWGTSVVNDSERILNEGIYTYGKGVENPNAEENGEANEHPSDTIEEATPPSVTETLPAEASTQQTEEATEPPETEDDMVGTFQS